MPHDLALEELVAFDVETRPHELNEKVTGDLNILVCFQETRPDEVTGELHCVLSVLKSLHGGEKRKLPCRPVGRLPPPGSGRISR